jgi:hypothetical protein
MMPALLIPVEGDPEVVEHADWTRGAVNAAIGSRDVLVTPVDWRPRSRHWVVLTSSTHGPSNPQASSLVRGLPVLGPALVLLMSERTGLVTGFTKSELLVLTTGLLVGEASRGLSASDPLRIAAGAGRAVIPLTQKGTD